MKHKKTITGAVLAANRANAQFSTGPRTERGKSNTRHNALQHGILAKKVALETDEERAEFEDLFEACRVEFGPEGLLETFLVEEIATLFWKLQHALGLETQELSGLHDVRHQVDTVFHGDLELPISEWDLPIDSSWYCERIVVRAVASEDDTNSNASRGPGVFQNQIISAVQNSQGHNGKKTGHLEVEAVLGSSLEKMTRYQSAQKRDLYRAIEVLRALQAKKHGREGGDFQPS